MCMEDIILGREQSGSQRNYSVGAAAEKILDADLTRTSLVLGSPIANTVTFSFETTPASGQGINLAVGNPPLVLNIKDHGDMVTRPIFAIGSGAGTNGAIWYSSLSRKK